MAFSGAFVKPFRPAFDAGLAAAAVPWYLAGGAPTPIAVYQPKGAADLATSYVNLVNPGTYDAAPGVAPTLDASGWVLNGTQYLSSGISVSSDHVVLVRFSNGIESTRILFSSINPKWFFVRPSAYSTTRFYFNTSEFYVSPITLSGIIALTKDGMYIDGILVKSINVGSFTNIDNMTIGAHPNGVDAFVGKIQAVAIWNTSTNHATWMPAVSAAVALI